MGVIALAAHKPWMEERFGVSFDEIPSARLRSYAEQELPRHLGVVRARTRSKAAKPSKVRAGSKSRPAQIRPMAFEQFHNVEVPKQATEEQKAVIALTADGDAKYPKKGATPRAMFFLDSGAFSVWSRGADITLDDFAEFLAATKEYVDYAFNLDVLPGAPGKPATRAEGEVTAKLSVENWEELRRQGFDTINTYHEGEPIEHLHYLRDMALEKMADPFIALSPLKTSGRAVRWFTEAWRHLVDSDGKPLLKVHGLGVLEYEGVTSFPWFSVDGTTWLNGMIYGTVCDWVWDGTKEVLRQIIVTRGLKDGRNGWFSRTTAEREKLARTVFECPVDDVATMENREWAKKICAFNLKSYKKLEGMMPETLSVGPQPRRLV